MPDRDPKLSGASIVRLRDQIASAFSVDDLRALVLDTFDEDLEKKIVSTNNPMDHIVFSLLKYSRGRGTLTRLLRAVRIERSEKTELVETIGTLCPSAMDDSDAAIEDVAQGFKRLDKLRKDANTPNSVREIIGASRAKIEVVVDGLKEFKRYKYLHDALHNIQLGPYHELTSNLDLLETTPEIADDLQLAVAYFKKICAEILPLVEKLSVYGDEYVKAKRWMDQLAITVESIGIALGEDHPYRPVRLGATKIGTLILQEQPYLNYKMWSCVERLQLQNLVELLDKIEKSDELSREQREPIADTKGKMENLWARLHGRVDVHNKWQDVETQLWAADYASGKILMDSEEFELSWQNARERIEPLWLQDPTADWVARTQLFGGRVDAAFQRQPVDLKSVKQNYGRFSVLARLQFQTEDTELKGLCDNLLTLSLPLSNLLSI